MGESVSLTLTGVGPGPSKERVSRLLAKVFPNQTKKRVAESLDALPLLLAPALSPQDGELLAKHIRARGGDVALNEVEAVHSPGYALNGQAQSVEFGSFEALSQESPPSPEPQSSWTPPTPEEEPEAAPAWAPEEVSEPAFLSMAGGISMYDDTPAKEPDPIQVPSPEVPEAQGTTILREVPNIDREAGPRGVAPRGSAEAPWEASATAAKAPWEEEEASKTGFTRLFKGLLKR